MNSHGVHRIFTEEGELADYFKALGINTSSFQKLLHQFEEAKTFGTLIQPCLSEMEIQSARSAIHNSYFILHNFPDLLVGATHLNVLRVLAQAEALTQRYHVVVANPPYMGGKGMNPTIKLFLQDNFADYKSDLFSAFIVRSLSLARSNGYFGFMSPFVWMFIPTYEKLREFRRSLDNLTRILHDAGSDLEHVVQTRNYVRDPANTPIFRDLYREYFKHPYPARTTITNCLPPSLHFEIECIATTKESAQ